MSSQQTKKPQFLVVAETLDNLNARKEPYVTKDDVHYVQDQAKRGENPIKMRTVDGKEVDVENPYGKEAQIYIRREGDILTQRFHEDNVSNYSTDDPIIADEGYLRAEEAEVEQSPLHPMCITQRYTQMRKQLMEKESWFESEASVERFFKDGRDTFLKSEFAAKLRGLVRDNRDRASLKGVRNIVAVGLGQLTPDEARPGQVYRAAWQHAFVELLRDLVEDEVDDRTDKGTITIHCQDPAYRPADQKVLEKNGFSVIQHPAAFLLVDGTSVLVDIYSRLAIVEFCAENGAPAVLFSGGLDDVDPNATDAELLTNVKRHPRVQAMMRRYTEDERLKSAKEEDYGLQHSIFIRND